MIFIGHKNIQKSQKSQSQSQSKSKVRKMNLARVSSTES